MAGKTNDDPKVMDVSKPGKGKIVINSRPVVAPVVSDTAQDQDVSTAPETSSLEPASAEPAQAPSATRKVIQPISIEDSGQQSKEPEAAEAPVVEDAQTPQEDSPSEVAPESTDSLPTPKADEDNPIAPEEPSSDSSGAASVDEMAKAAEAKRLAGEKSKEEAEREQKAEELIKSKQYVVPISHASHSSKKTIRNTAITLLLLAALGAAGYFAYEAGLFGNQQESPKPPVSASSKSSETDSENEVEKTADDIKNTDTEQTLDSLARGNDEDRKNELRNLQQKLETYYNDNSEYPATLTELGVTEDEVSGPKNDAYTYTSTEDKQHYTLSAELENSSDKDAANGIYTISSVN